MNDLTHPLQSHTARTTRGAEGLPRWRWTTAELVRLTELGAFTAVDRFELIGGEIVPMSPVGRRHEVVAEQIEDALRAKAPADFRVRTERQFNLADDAYTKPDIFVHAAAVAGVDQRGDTVLLVVEVADSSLEYDLGGKARLYTSFGVREYWVVDARTLATRVHRDPGVDGYARVSEIGSGGLLVPHLVPAMAISLADLDMA